MFMMCDGLVYFVLAVKVGEKQAATPRKKTASPKSNVPYNALMRKQCMKQLPEGVQDVNDDWKLI